MFDRYEIQSKRTQETCSSVDDDEQDEKNQEILDVNISYLHDANPSHTARRGVVVDLEQTTNATRAMEEESHVPEQPFTREREQANDESSSSNHHHHRKIRLGSRTVTWLRYIISVVLLLFSAVVVVATIVTEQTTLARQTHPVVALVLLVVFLFWLAALEGGQGCLVGLQEAPLGVDHATSHPWTTRCTTVMQRPGYLERFIVGRQFLVVLVVFGINACGSAVAEATLKFLPTDVLQQVFVTSGVALMLVTIVVGQLAAQVNAARCMMDFLNHRFMLWFVVYVSLAMEATGLMHVVYLVQRVFHKFTTGTQPDEEEETDEPSSSASSSSSSRCSKMFFWIRVVLSLAVLGFALAVTLSALFHGQTAMWPGVPTYASLIIFLVLMCLVGLMEGMQIALFAVVNLPAHVVEEQGHAMARKNCQVVFQGSNFQALLIGRQICVTICMFLVARITTIQANDDDSSDDATIFGVPHVVQQFFQTGLLGAVITTIVGSLAWRVVASSFPLAFLSNPLIYVLIRLCLWLEASGVCTAAWLLAAAHKRLAGMQTDDVYLGGKGNHREETERGAPPSGEEKC